MNNPRIHIILASLFWLIILAACTEASATATKPAIQLEPCYAGPAKAECGTLNVYENRDAQTGRMIPLKIAVIRARNGQPSAGAIFWLSGGPGEAATRDDGNIQGLLPLLDERDLVLVDQRGTGDSNMVVPPQTPDWSGLGPEELENAYAAWIKEVLPTLNADPRFYTTSIAMDDLDEVRQALGYEEIDLIGGSYGATAAQYYLRQHEDHIRSVVLISGSVGNLPIWEHQAANAQQALDAIFSRCESNSKCNSDYPNIRSEFTALMERLKAEPVTIEVGDGTITLTNELLAAKVEDMTRDASRVPSLLARIHDAYADDDWRAFGPAPYGDWSNTIMSYSIQCNEAWAAFTPEETMRLGQGSYLLGWNLLRAYRFTLICKYLPPGVTPEGDSQQPGSKVPVLLFNGELDPIDPPANIALAREIWPNSLALTLPGQGHSISDREIWSCMLENISKFLDQGSVENLPTECLKNIHPPSYLVNP